MRKEFKEKEIRHFQVGYGRQNHAIPLGDEGTIEVEVEILDKVIPHAFIHGGTCIIIIPLSTLKKLGLDMIGP